MIRRPSDKSIVNLFAWWMTACVTVPALAQSVSTSQTAATTNPASDEARFVIMQVQAAYDQVKDIDYHFRQNDITNPKSAQEVEHGTVNQSGECWASDLQTFPTASETGKPLLVERKGFVGPKSCGCSTTGADTAQEFIYDNPAGMTDSAANALIPSQPPHPEYFAFGDGNDLLSSLFREANSGSGTASFRIRDQGGSNPSDAVIHLELYFKVKGQAWPTVPSETFDIDPQMGFMVTRIVQRMPVPPYIKFCQADIVPRKIAGTSTWYPEKITRYGYDLKGSTVPTNISEFAFDDVVLSRSRENEVFSVKALNIPEGGQLLRWNPDGGQVLLKRAHDAFVLVSKQPQSAVAPSSEKIVSSPPPSSPQMRYGRYLSAAVLAFLAGFLLLYWSKIADNRRRSRTGDEL